MLDAYIIEELKKRQDRRRREDRRPVVEIPSDEERSDTDFDVDRKKDDSDESRTIIIDFGN